MGDDETLPTCISGLRFKDLTEETNAASLERGPGAVKWFDHGGSFVLPGSGEPAFVLPSPPLAFAPAWQKAFLEAAVVTHRQVSGQIGESGRTLPEATVYHLDRTAADALRDLILGEAGGAPISWSSAVVFDPDTEQHPLAKSASFEYGLDLIGYTLPTGQVLRRGETLELLSVWRPRNELPAKASDLRVFVHVMDAQSRVWGAEDRLDMHPPTWEQGDLLVQYHKISLAADAPPGTYQLEIGVYAPITMKRLSLYAGTENERPVGDRVLLSPISVIE